MESRRATVRSGDVAGSMALGDDVGRGINVHCLRRVAGRALYVGPEGEVYVARAYDVYRSSDWGATWQLDCRVPASGWKPLAAKVRLGARLLRHEIAAFLVLGDGARLAVARDGIYRAGPDEVRMTRVFPITRGARPLNLTVDGDRVIFGEYGRGLESVGVRIYVSEDGGRRFDVGYEFPKGDIRHVHNVVVDPYRDHYWVLAGDYGRQPGIAALSKDMRTFEWLQRGNQRVRVVSAFVEPDRLIYGTDSNSERNFILSLDKESGRLDELCEIDGSSIFAATFGPVSVVSTCVEGNPACPSRESALYASTDRVHWERVVAHKKDRHHHLFFQLGALVLPYAHNAQPRGMYSGQAVEGADNRVVMVDFQIAE